MARENPWERRRGRRGVKQGHGFIGEPGLPGVTHPSPLRRGGRYHKSGLGHVCARMSRLSPLRSYGMDDFMEEILRLGLALVRAQGLCGWESRRGSEVGYGTRCGGDETTCFPITCTNS
eukprot:scaffold625_cov324-Pavlova_lutheri.AAC.35